MRERGLSYGQKRYFLNLRKDADRKRQFVLLKYGNTFVPDCGFSIPASTAFQPKKKNPLQRITAKHNNILLKKGESVSPGHFTRIS